MKRAFTGIFALLTTVGLLAGCSTVPTSQFIAYDNAVSEVTQTASKLLEDYDRAINATESDFKTNVPPPIPPAFNPAKALGLNHPDIVTRRNAIEAIQTYNQAMLFLAQGGPSSKVQAQIGKLVTAVGSVFPPASQAGGWAKALIGTLQRARSAKAFENALNAATQPGRHCPAGAQMPNDDGAPKPETTSDDKTPETSLPSATEVVGCKSVMAGLFDLMEADTPAFYAAQLRVYELRLGLLSDKIGTIGAAIVDEAKAYRRPTAGSTVARRLKIVEQRLGTAQGLVRGNKGPTTVALGESRGPAMTERFLQKLESNIPSIDKIILDANQLGFATIEYHSNLKTYVQSIAGAERYLAELVTATNAPIDTIGIATDLFSLGGEVKSGAISSRMGFEKAGELLFKGSD